MTDSETPTTDIPQVDPDAVSSIMVGHAISKLDDEAAVCISINDQWVRLSPEGARIAVAQITAWADHAEKHNKAQPTAAITKLIYRVVGAVGKDKAWGEAPKPPGEEPPKKEWSVRDAGDGKMMATFGDKSDHNKLAEAAAAILQTARKRTKSRTAKKSARKAKR